MATSSFTPLQLTLAAAMTNNSLFTKFANTDLESSITAYQANYLSPLRAAIADGLAVSPSWLYAGTLITLRTLTGTAGAGAWLTGACTSGATILLDDYGNAPLMVDYVNQLAGYYHGLGPYPSQSPSYSTFAQMFGVVSGFITNTRDVVYARQNANTYLGPTFTSMDALTTANITNVNPVFDKFGYDIARQGNLVDTTKLDIYGTPAALIQQISKQAKITNATVPALQDAMLAEGVSPFEIADLVNDNRYSLFNQDGMLDNDFDRLQKSAYQAMTTVTGTDLTEILKILNVTTPNITRLDDLLDPVKIFPLSYSTLLTPSLNGNLFIFDEGGNVNSSISSTVNAYLPSLSGCDELGKIIPQAQATANKAIQVALQNIPGIANSSWPALAQAIARGTPRTWNPNQEYLPNTLVSVPTATVPDYYQSVQEVPAGTDINDAAFWDPVDLENMQTMQGLPDINAQTTPISTNTANIIDNQVATGTGEYGAVTYYDFMGLAVNNTALSNYLNTVNSSIATVVTAAGVNITNLQTIFSRMENVANGTYGAPQLGPVTVPAGLGAGTYNPSFPYSAADNALLALAALVPAEIDAIVAAYPVQNTVAQSAWADLITAMLSYQSLVDRAGLQLNALVANDSSTFTFAQTITQYAQDQITGGAYQYLNAIADTSTEGGQALVGCLREASNQTLLDQSNISGRPQTQIPGQGTAGNDFVDPPVASGLLENYPTSRSQINAT